MPLVYVNQRRAIIAIEKGDRKVRLGELQKLAQIRHPGLASILAVGYALPEEGTLDTFQSGVTRRPGATYSSLSAHPA